jgi:hypothetical protein
VKWRTAAWLCAALFWLTVVGATSRCSSQTGTDENPNLPQGAGAHAATAGSVPHGNHNPRYGGVVLMNGNLHFEVVLDRSGLYRVYFSDAIRNELPASVVSNVTIAIDTKSGPPERLALHIDDTGESWMGQGQEVRDPEAVAHIAYSFQAAPYQIDLPFPKR